uniref:Uncharacterized protein n=2 Tax=Oryza sativa subsp. japonica TaxID=39947 RepID=Q5WMN0_ORYSJ|nr:hypothetical protein [Oryza sativa Japonica Group]AAV32238.1 hypothetical protein [Oryza sativa Japonica Group]
MALPLLSSPLTSSIKLWTRPSRARREPLPLAAGALEPANTTPTRHHYSRAYHRGLGEEDKNEGEDVGGVERLEWIRMERIRRENEGVGRIFKVEGGRLDFSQVDLLIGPNEKIGVHLQKCISVYGSFKELDAKTQVDFCRCDQL